MLAMTTTQAFWVLDYDAASAWQIDCGKGVYYGISFWNERLYVAARQARVGSNRDQQDNVVLCYQNDLRLERIIKAPKPIRDAHQITAADGVLYVACSYDDEIACYDIDEDDWTFWQPFAPYSGGGLDVHHINSIFISGDEILLAGLRPKGWVARFERSTRKLVSRKDLGAETHNVWLDGSLIHVCSSSDYAILREDEQSYQLPRHAWTRGYCTRGDRRFIGASENLTRAHRAFSDCNVLELDNHYKYVSAVWLRGFGMLHDLRGIDVPDSMSHNGQAFNLKRSSLDQRFLKHILSRTAGRLRGPSNKL
jgi:hypothetical protein